MSPFHDSADDDDDELNEEDGVGDGNHGGDADDEDDDDGGGGGGGGGGGTFNAKRPIEGSSDSASSNRIAFMAAAVASSTSWLFLAPAT